MSKAYVTVTDEQGFNTAVVGPFPNIEAADEWVDKMEDTYVGHCQEPYQAFVPTAPEDYKED